MYIQKLRNRLETLNPLIWNPEVDRLLGESGYPNETDFESAAYRYIIAIRDDENNRKDGNIPLWRYLINDARVNRRIQKLIDDAINELKSYKNAYNLLSKGFQSDFAQQVLSRHEDTIAALDRPSPDNFKAMSELIVLMSHEDFLGTEDKFEQKNNYTYVKVNNKGYTFNLNQARVVELLHESNGAHVTQIAEKIESCMEKFRLRDCFDKGKHPAWKTFIIEDSNRKGFYCLNY